MILVVFPELLEVLDPDQEILCIVPLAGFSVVLGLREEELGFDAVFEIADNPGGYGLELVGVEPLWEMVWGLVQVVGEVVFVEEELALGDGGEGPDGGVYVGEEGVGETEGVVDPVDVKDLEG